MNSIYSRLYNENNETRKQDEKREKRYTSY